MHSYIFHQRNRRRKFSSKIKISLFFLIIINFLIWTCCHCSSTTLFSIFINKDNTATTSTSFDHLIPSNRFDLFWTMWNTNQSTFHSHRILLLESLFIHHPQATVIILSPTLNDTQLFLPFRHRGYRIYSFNISLQHILLWHWYSSNQTKDFLQHWNTSGPYFYTHLTDYLRTIVLYLYGGTYMDMDALTLQPFPNEEFIGLAQTVEEQCKWCIEGTSNLYLAPGIMRFRPYRKVLRHILENTFNHQVYNPSCFHCFGIISYTQHIIAYRKKNDSEVMNLKLLEPHRLYPSMWSEISTVFHRVEQDTLLDLADLMKRSYSLHLFGHATDELNVTRGSLIDHHFNRYNLGDLRPKVLNRNQSNNDVRLICPSLYVYTRQKQGRFIGRDVVYLRLNETFGNEDVRWNITMYVSSGKIILSPQRSLSDLNQAQINSILNELYYEPDNFTSTDTLMIDVKSENVFVACDLTILIFSRMVTILTTTMGTSDRWPAIQRLAASVERYFPQTKILIASDSGKPIDKTTLLNFTSSDNISGYNLRKTFVIYDLPEDSGLSKCRNYLVNRTKTPFFFLLDDDFELEEGSHLDILLELVYIYEHIDIIAGKIPEDVGNFNDFSGIFLRYNQTLKLVHNVPIDHKDEVLFPRSVNDEMNDGNPCRQVDFVPNVFMGRTKAVRSTPWNDEFKLDEHEDFFLRFAQANRKVYTCEYIHVHRQSMMKGNK